MLMPGGAVHGWVRVARVGDPGRAGSPWPTACPGTAGCSRAWRVGGAQRPSIGADHLGSGLAAGFALVDPAFWRNCAGTREATNVSHLYQRPNSECEDLGMRAWSAARQTS